jgi:predicted transcriptional regulator
MRRKMMSLTIELDEQTAAVVQALAANENRSVSDVIRDAVAAYPGRRNRPLPKGVGKYQSGQPDTAQNIREIIRKDVQEGKWP